MVANLNHPAPHPPTPAEMARIQTWEISFKYDFTKPCRDHVMYVKPWGVQCTQVQKVPASGPTITFRWFKEPGELGEKCGQCLILVGSR